MSVPAAGGGPDGPDVASPDDVGDGPAGTGGKPSGLRNPAAAVRGLGAGTLIIEAVVLLLAIQPIRLMGGQLSGAGVAVVVALAVWAVVVSGLMKRSWAWHAGTVLQVCLLLSGFLHWSLGALGVIFAATWGYATYVRRTILG
ncbi:DUF4233 domain-containing protein [Spirilliplanes yamanashiensis]|uniref:DUF4233 domain-containing protein n=1 Tax=Spirilliplanes yamanashiensis TaxID=42233 RepID=A0A8J3YDT7_9ACTN|nr:hypothetical protein Sya03_53290 [Spirilliplanes yamanashiensis]